MSSEQPRFPHALRIETIDTATPGALAKRHIVRGVIAKGESLVVGGEPKCGKSVLVADLLAAIAYAEDWRGYRTRRPAGALVVALERGADWIRMLKAQAARRGKGRLPVAVHRRVFNLLDPGSVEALADTVRAGSETLGVEIEIVVIDTLGKGIAAGGGDENSPRDMGAAMANLGRLRDATGVATIVVHHFGKDGTLRGSNALRGDADVVIEVKPRGGARIAEVVDANDLEPGHLTTFAIEGAIIGVDEDGGPIATRIVAATTEDTAAPDPRDNLSPDQRLILDAIAAAETVTAVTEGVGNGSWRESVTMAMRGRSEGAIRKAISTGLKALIAKGLIEKIGACYRVTKADPVTPGNGGNAADESVTARPRPFRAGGDGNVSRPERASKPKHWTRRKKPRPKTGAPEGARRATAEATS